MSDSRNKTMQRASHGFTLVELLVVIAIIGIFVALMLPAVQAARESARRMQCTANLGQLGLAVSNYASANGHLPAGTQADSGPILNQPRGYHHGWIGQILPYMDQQNAFAKTDFSVSAYHPNNEPVRSLTLPVLICPSSSAPRTGNSHYAGVHHHTEAPIDVDNSGVFFLNSAVRYDDITDGASHTLFIGEKIAEKNSLGWMSGTRSILRNLGGGLNVTGRPAGPGAIERDYSGDDFFGYGYGYEPGDLSANEDPNENTEDEKEIPVRPPTVPIAVGGFASFHSGGGAMFSLGDGSVRYLANETNRQVLQQLANRADGQLLDSLP